MIIRQPRLRQKLLRFQGAALLFSLAALAASSASVVSLWPGALTVAKWAFMCGSLLLTWAVFLHGRSTGDIPRWAWVRRYRKLTALVRLREDPDAAEGTYRAYHYLRVWQPWQPGTVITRVSVNAFDHGDTLAFGPCTFTFEQLVHGHDAHHYG